MNSKPIVRSLLKWFEANARDLPWRRTRDPYAIWVSEIMLQQTQVKTVVPYWNRWMETLPTIDALAWAKPEKIHKLWEGLGYYTRVRNMQKAARLVVEKHGGEFPKEFEQVLELPGIGRYTAGAVCSIAFNQPCPILDGNVIRVLSRVFSIEGDPKGKAVNSQLWGLAARLVREADRQGRARKQDTAPIVNEPKAFCSLLNQALMELGALVCTPQEPKCKGCPLARRCLARKHGRTAELPALATRPATTRRRFVAFVAERAGQFLVRQRPNGVVNAHLWEFPNAEVSCTDGDPTPASRKVFGFTPSEIATFQTVNHTITRYRIRMDVYRVTLRHGNLPQSKTRWLSKERLHRLAFASAHKKILERL